ncbi:hypothetical protein OVA03_07045 [Asticcacaulis sp. SL142]|uniref:hypothetical protein n=1 Tax=Asticcacaulis sp. SL142 TaxID=2995155 RepID=UPI00226D33E5|nr:hypothetical protein [Asticcacaulis sp. SL142]WAC49650.1 hypothetical protein OVA03_07045 [Asticcacaulis sp. SL142]
MGQKAKVTVSRWPLGMIWQRHYLIWIVLICICFGGWWGCARPSSEAIVPIPEMETVVKMQFLPEWDEGAYQLIIHNKSGQFKTKLWSNWGPATRASFYLTPDNNLVVIGSGGNVYAFAIGHHYSPTKLDINKDLNSADGMDWRFIGTTDGRGSIQFTPASEGKECIDLLGAGTLPYSKPFHSQHWC